jgi:hypothetical protein
LTFDPVTGLLSGTPTRADVGSHPVSLLVTDLAGLTAAQNFTLEIISTNEAPVASDSSVDVDEDSRVIIELQATDPDLDPLNYQIVTQPENGSITLNGNQITYVPSTNFNGQDSLSFVVSDAEFSSEPAVVNISVLPINDEPVAEADRYELAQNANNQYSLSVLENDADVDGDKLAIDGASSSVGTVTIGEAGIVLTVPNLYVGPVSLRYTLNDGHGGRATSTASLIITGGSSDELPLITVPSDVTVDATGSAEHDDRPAFGRWFGVGCGRRCRDRFSRAVAFSTRCRDPTVSDPTGPVALFADPRRGRGGCGCGCGLRHTNRTDQGPRPAPCLARRLLRRRDAGQTDHRTK